MTTNDHMGGAQGRCPQVIIQKVARNGAQGTVPKNVLYVFRNESVLGHTSVGTDVTECLG